MSGVPERLRNLSEREFYNTAIELRVEVLGIITSSAIPKSQRFTFAVPMAETARSVVYNIVKSEAFYPNTPENVAARKRYLTLAVADCERKTRVVKLTRGFTFLKKRFRFTESGRIVVTPIPKSLARERRKLRIHARMVAEGSMTLEQAYVSYMSFRGSLERKRGDGRPRFRMDVHWIVRDFDKLFAELVVGAGQSHAADTMSAHPLAERSPHGH